MRPLRTYRVLIILWAILMAMFWLGWLTGKHSALNKIPSCIYIKRPSLGDIKPLGYDNRQGVDASFSDIQGGGYYISLEKWKRQ